VVMLDLSLPILIAEVLKPTEVPISKILEGL